MSSIGVFDYMQCLKYSYCRYIWEEATWRCSTKKVFLEKEKLFGKIPAGSCFLNLEWIKDFTKFAGKHLWWSLLLWIAASWRREACLKRVFPKVLPYEFCKIFKNTYFEKHLQQPKSELNLKFCKINGKTTMMELRFFLYEIAG